MTTSESPQASGIMLKSLSGEEPIELIGEMVIGRGSASDLVIDHERLSRKHAKLSAGDAAVLVEDLGSTNGTFVNDERVEGSILAKHGDVIKFDTCGYEVFVVGGVDATDSTVSGEAIPEEEVLEAKTQMFAAPKSWALDDNPSSDGTQVMSLDMLKKSAPADDQGSSIADDLNVDVPVLVCISGDLKGKIFKFNTREKLTKWEIGRDSGCEIQIDDGSVSTNHAQLIHEGRRWKLIDLMSANGTYVNEAKGLTSYLSSGDKIRFGQVEFMFKLSSNGETTDPSVGQARRKAAGKVATGKAKPAVPTWAIAVGAFVVTAVILYFVLG
jgi:pSer/pThr/pTyr-binding forkhead associated (FHA) protein